MTVLRLICSAILVTLLSAYSAAADTFIDFNIPSAPLEAALGSFGRMTKEQLLLDASITDGRRSSAIIGRFTPEAALRQMLGGTGLMVRSVEGQGFAIVPETEGMGRKAAAAARFESYSALIQTALGRALCGRPDTIPGGYRVLTRLWIGADGTVDHAELLTSSGEAGRDALLKARFRGVAIGAPPAGLPQPVTMLVTSEGAGDDYCAALGRARAVTLDAR